MFWVAFTCVPTDLQPDVWALVHARLPHLVQRWHLSLPALLLLPGLHEGRQYRGNLRHTQDVCQHLKVGRWHRTGRTLHTSLWQLHCWGEGVCVMWGRGGLGVWERERSDYIPHWLWVGRRGEGRTCVWREELLEVHVWWVYQARHFLVACSYYTCKEVSSIGDIRSNFSWPSDSAVCVSGCAYCGKL